MAQLSRACTGGALERVVMAIDSTFHTMIGKYMYLYLYIYIHTHTHKLLIDWEIIVRRASFFFLHLVMGSNVSLLGRLTFVDREVNGFEGSYKVTVLKQYLPFYPYRHIFTYY